MKRILWIGMALLLAAGLAACQDGGQPVHTAKTAPPSQGQPEASVPAETQEPSPTEAAPLDYTWQPHVFSGLYREIFGEEAEQAFYRMIDAVLAGEDAFPCAKREYLYCFAVTSSACFPPYARLVDEITWKDGTASIAYACEDGERQAVLEDFERNVTEIVTSAVRQGDSAAARAAALYLAYVPMVAYDAEALEQESGDLSSYRALTQFSGVCQSFAPAYVYLCLQCGVDAVPAGGLSDSGEAHQWAMVMLDGAHYYMDPTYENGAGGRGMRYFGMTGQKRELEGGYPADDVNIGEVNERWGRDIDVSDQRFASLWEAETVLGLKREDGRATVECVREDGSQFAFVLQDSATYGMDGEGGI